MFLPQRKERNRTVARFTHNDTAYTIHERISWTSDGTPYKRRFVCRVSDGSYVVEANNVRQARLAL